MTNQEWICLACGNVTTERYEPNKCAQCRRTGNFEKHESKEARQQGLDGF